MLRSVNSMVGFSITDKDDKVGRLDELFFDHKTWTVRYLVVEADGWISKRKVLISPIALGKLDWQMETFLLNLPMEKIRSSPEINTEKPISRPLEIELFKHYQWPAYWEQERASGIGMGAHSPDPQNLENSHLHGTHVTMSIHAVDGEIGQVEDYIVNSETWAINFLVVNTANWLPGKKVLISPQLVSHVDVEKKEIFVNLMKEVVEKSQEFDPTQLVNTVYEAHLYDYYGRAKSESAPRTRLFGF